MATQAASKTLASAFMYEAQTLFITAKPGIRYGIALALLAFAGYMVSFVPHFDLNHAYAYALCAGVYGWEISLGLAVMLAIIGVFKLLALLPLGVAIVVVSLVVLYAGV